ncbi:hypothetical protein [Almyronema epifaneia]|uniref:Uncharacterized protein n=1 Tax=Almyronema epifaneia S1 TaxID=2991925 RepID=A0ABW6ICG1_9CYAN
MTKKRLSDLLREEVDKPEETAAAQSAEAATSSAESQPPPAQPASQAAGETQATSRSSRSRGPTKADLEKRVSELETALAEARDRETDITQRTEGLKSDLSKQQTLIFQLKEKLEKSEAAAKETTQQLDETTQALSEAKKTILHLTEAAKAPPTQVKTSPAAPELQPAAAPTPAKQRQPLALSSRPPAALPRYVAPSAQPKMLTDDEIGWVD